MHLNERPTYGTCCDCKLLPLVMVLPLSVQHLLKVRVTFNVIALTDNLPNLTQRTGERGQQLPDRCNNPTPNSQSVRQLPR
jgi:hypothetical protein